MKKVKFFKRLKIWIPSGENLDFDWKSQEIKRYTRAEVINDALKGKCYTFLRTISTKCSCGCCSNDKYKRTPKQFLKRDIWKDI